MDYIIDLFSKVKTKKMKPLIRNLLRMSVYQLRYMDSVPDSAVCNEAVKLAADHHLQGLTGFVNGVLRSISRRKEEFVFTDWPRKYSMPEWIIEMWMSVYPEETVEAMLQAFLTDTPVAVRCNLNLASMEEIMESRSEEGRVGK